MELKHLLGFHLHEPHLTEQSQLIPEIFNNLPSGPIYRLDLDDGFGKLKLLTVVSKRLYFSEKSLLVGFLFLDELDEGSDFVTVEWEIETGGFGLKLDDFVL